MSAARVNIDAVRAVLARTHDHDRGWAHAYRDDVGALLAEVERLTADLASQALAAGELAQLVERHADAAQVLTFERDVLAERVAALEAELAAYRVPMTEEELRERGNALARAALDREWALARAPRVEVAGG